MTLCMKQVLGLTANLAPEDVTYVTKALLKVPIATMATPAPPGACMLLWLFDLLKGKQILGPVKQATDVLRMRVLQEYRTDLINFEKALMATLKHNDKLANDQQADEPYPQFEIAFFDQRYVFITGRNTAWSILESAQVPDPQEEFMEVIRLHVNLTHLFLSRLDLAQHVPGPGADNDAVPEESAAK
jgi:hypothetical protein